MDEIHQQACFPLSSGVAAIGLSWLFFHVLLKVVERLPRPAGISVAPDKWDNIIVSALHGLIAGLWAAYCLVTYPEAFNNAVLYSNAHLYCLVAFSTGYFVHDTVSGPQRALLNKRVTLAHHIPSIIIMSINVLYCMSLIHTTLAVSLEISGVFLHSRKLLRWSKKHKDNPMYDLIKWLNLIIFVVLRFPGLGKIIYDLPQSYGQTSLLYSVSLTSLMIILYIINIGFFVTLVKADVLRSSPELKQENGTINTKEE